nr:DUF2971 domain-containing protein [Cupriavidus necator]
MHDTLHKSDPVENLFEFYITSFCTPNGDYSEARNHGLLSQWRYYGGNGGYSLVFDTAELERLMEQEHSVWPCRLSCGDVSYSSDSAEVMERRLDSLPSLRNALSVWFKRGSSPEAIEPVLEPFLNCCIHYKHWAFAEEREVRLVATLNGERARRLHEIDGSKLVERPRHSFMRGGQSVPHIRLFEGLDVGRAPRLPIRRIIVGPGPTQDERETKLKAFLKSKGYVIDVTCSSIPIRF